MPTYFSDGSVKGKACYYGPISKIISTTGPSAQKSKLMTVIASFQNVSSAFNLLSDSL